MKIGILLSRIRTDEKLLIAAARTRGHEVVIIDNTATHFDLGCPSIEVDVLLERCIDHHRAVYALKIAEDWGIPTVSSYSVAEISGNRLLAEVALREHGVSTPEVRIAFTPDSALEAMEEIGYPVVLKPVEGPSGQLISRIQDKFTAQTILEHKRILGSYHHSIFFVQKYVEAPGHDVRAFVVGDEVVAAIAVMTNHWLTPIEDGGLVDGYPLSEELIKIATTAVKAVGGGVLAVDLVRTKDSWHVIDLSQATGLAQAEAVTGTDISGRVMDYAVSRASGEIENGSVTS